MAKRYSKEWRKNLSKARRKRKVEPMSGKHHSLETREKMRKAKLGKKRGKHTEESKQKISEGRKGKKHSKEVRKKMSEVKRGKKHPNWQGGVTEESERIRKNVEYRLWREAVFARDNWTCQKTGIKSGIKINAHHIEDFSTHPELRFAIDNGVTLSKEAHQEFHNTYGKNNTTRKQLEEFLNYLV